MGKTFQRFATTLIVLALAAGTMALARPTDAPRRSENRQVTSRPAVVSYVQSSSVRTSGRIADARANLLDRLGIRALRFAWGRFAIQAPRVFGRWGLSDTPDPTGNSDDSTDESQEEEEREDAQKQEGTPFHP